MNRQSGKSFLFDKGIKSAFRWKKPELGGSMVHSTLGVQVRATVGIPPLNENLVQTRIATSLATIRLEKTQAATLW